MRTTTLGRALLLAGIGALLAFTPAVAAASAGATTARLAASPDVMRALSVPAGIPTKCPPASVIGKALGLHLTGPTLVNHAGGVSLECQYTGGIAKTTLTWTKENQAVFLAVFKTLKKSLGAKSVTGLGPGVTAFSVLSVEFSFQKGTVACIISSFGPKPAQMTALAEKILASYW